MADQDTQETTTPWWKELVNDLPLDDLTSQATEYAKALAEKGSSGLTDKLNDFTESMTPGGGGGASGEAVKKGAEKLSEGKNPASAGASALFTGAKEKLTPGSSGGSSGGSSDVRKFSNIVESIEVGVPVRVAYNQWTQFQDWTSFMKRVEKAEQESEEKIEFTGKVFLSHRSWKATITQQVPDEQIVWESSGEKGHLDGAVTFHELGPRLTRILIIVNYYPKGFVEKVGNMGRPVGKRIRVESRLFARYVMTQTILDEDAVEGWRGEIRDREVVRTHEEALEDEQREAEDSEQEDAAEDEDYPENSGEADETDGSDEDGSDEADEVAEEDPDDVDDSSDEEDGDDPEEPEDSQESEDAEEPEESEEPEEEGSEDPESEEPDADTDPEDEAADEPDADSETDEDPETEEDPEPDEDTETETDDATQPDDATETDADPEETADSGTPEEDGDFEYVEDDSETKEGTS